MKKVLIVLGIILVVALIIVAGVVYVTLNSGYEEFIHDCVLAGKFTRAQCEEFWRQAR
jgi:uncharacterized membrane protein YqhA